MHQRERGYLPALNQTAVTSTTQFSKSAPNLDKSRANLGLPTAAAAAAAAAADTTAMTATEPQDANGICTTKTVDSLQPSQQCSTTSSSHNNILGKNKTNANEISAPHHHPYASSDAEISMQLTSCSSSINSNSTNQTTTHRYNIGSLDALHCNGERYTYDDDDDDVEVKGCFAFIRGDDGYVKRKKHSLDSKMAEHNHQQPVQQTQPPQPQLQSNNLVNFRVPIITATPTVTVKANRELFDRPPVEMYAHDENHGAGGEVGAGGASTRDEPPYDRVFYRNIQKSLEEIFARDDFNQRFASQKSRNSKSSGDLTVFNDEDDVYGQYDFQRSNSKSKFQRECFFVNHDADDSSDDGGIGVGGGAVDDDDDDASDPNVSIKSNDTSTNQRNQDYGHKSSVNESTTHENNTIDTLLNENSSNFSRNSNCKLYHHTQDDRTNSICSDHSSTTDMSITPSSTSRKLSDDELSLAHSSFNHDASHSFIAQFNAIKSNSSSENKLIYANLETSSLDASRKILPKPKSTNHTRYASIDHQKNQVQTNSLHKPTNGLVTTKGVSVLKSALVKKDKKDKQPKSKCIGLPRFFKFRKGTVLHSNSFYNKGEDKTEMNEQLLLDDDKTAHSTSSSTNDPIYDSVFRTKNFLLAKTNDT